MDSSVSASQFKFNFSMELQLEAKRTGQVDHCAASIPIVVENGAERQKTFVYISDIDCPQRKRSSNPIS